MIRFISANADGHCHECRYGARELVLRLSSDDDDSGQAAGASSSHQELSTDSTGRMRGRSPMRGAPAPKQRRLSGIVAGQPVDSRLCGDAAAINDSSMESGGASLLSARR